MPNAIIGAAVGQMVALMTGAVPPRWILYGWLVVIALQGVTLRMAAQSREYQRQTISYQDDSIRLLELGLRAQRPPEDGQ